MKTFHKVCLIVAFFSIYLSPLLFPGTWEPLGRGVTKAGEQFVDLQESLLDKISTANFQWRAQWRAQWSWQPGAYRLDSIACNFSNDTISHDGFATFFTGGTEDMNLETLETCCYHLGKPISNDWLVDGWRYLVLVKKLISEIPLVLIPTFYYHHKICSCPVYPWEDEPMEADNGKAARKGMGMGGDASGEGTGQAGGNPLFLGSEQGSASGLGGDYPEDEDDSDLKYPADYIDSLTEKQVMMMTMKQLKKLARSLQKKHKQQASWIVKSVIYKARSGYPSQRPRRKRMLKIISVLCAKGLVTQSEQSDYFRHLPRIR